jgi:hypothetical protein
MRRCSMTDRTYPYYLVRTAFHGGGVVSRHWSQAGAETARAKYLRHETCLCGCVVVVASEEYERLPYSHDDVHYAQAVRR